MTARYLVDKSALARMPLPAVRDRLAPILDAGDAATCAIIDLEVLFSARNAVEHSRIRERRRLAYQQIPVTQSTLDRAIDVQGLLAKRAQHRISIPDLIVAATAEGAALTVLHYDADFDLIAKVTGQRMEWVVPRGSVP